MILSAFHCLVKQYVRNKPRPVGLKKFVLYASSGLVMGFEVYQRDSIFINQSRTCTISYTETSSNFALRKVCLFQSVFYYIAFVSKVKWIEQLWNRHCYG